jgi:methionyl-tRNA formyltransferase
MKKRIVPFVNHEIGYRLLQKLISQANKNSFFLAGVITSNNNNDSWWQGVEKLCAREKIQLYIYEDLQIENFALLNADWFLLLSWGHIIPPNLLVVPKKGTINLHYSLLPDLRGTYPVNWSLIEGMEKTGFTYHLIDEEIDKGQILIQFEVPIKPSDTARSLLMRIDDAVYGHFDDFIELLLEDKVQILTHKIPNAEINSSSEKYYSKDKFMKCCQIDLEGNYSGLNLLNLLRGLSFLPNSKNAFFLDKKTGKKIYININLFEE